MSKERSEKLTEALSALIVKQPFFATLLLNLCKIHEGHHCKGFDKETFEPKTIPFEGPLEGYAAAVCGTEIFINEKEFKKLDIKQREFVICHEVMHVVFNHGPRAKLWHDTVFGPDGKLFNPQKFFSAADYVINDQLFEAGLDSPPYQVLHNKSIATYEDVVDEVYKKLPDDEQQEQGHDHHEFGQEGEGQPSEDELKRALVRARNAAKAVGNLPGSLDRLVTDFVEPKVDWKKELATSFTSIMNKDDMTWARPNRKRLINPPHIYTPGLMGYTCGEIVVQIDVSGSISDDELKVFMSEVSGILSEAKPEKLWLFWVDTQVSGIDELESPEELLDVQPKGGGGTYMPAGFQKIEEMGIEPEVMVILTDGYTDFGQEQHYPVIWVSTSQPSPWGKNIEMKI